MTILSAILAAISALSAVIAYLRDKKALDGATAEILSRNLQGALDEIRTAQKEREAVRAAAAADPSSLRLPDKNSRD